MPQVSHKVVVLKSPIIKFDISICRIPITNFLVAGVDKKRRRKRQTSAEGGSPVGTTRNVEVVDPVDQDYYPEEYFDFYRYGAGGIHDSSWGKCILPFMAPLWITKDKLVVSAGLILKS